LKGSIDVRYMHEVVHMHYIHCIRLSEAHNDDLKYSIMELFSFLTDLYILVFVLLHVFVLVTVFFLLCYSLVVSLSPTATVFQ